MKKLLLVMAGLATAAAGEARAEPDCRFKGVIDKKTVSCAVQVTGQCGEILKGLAGGPQAEALKDNCGGYRVICENEILAETESACSAQNFQSNDGYGFVQMQLSAFDGSHCLYPVLRFDSVAPIPPGRIDARLYLSPKDVLFGSCRHDIFGTR